MSTDLIAYFSKRFSNEEQQTDRFGPFLTISRQTGCNATALAREMVREFRRRGVNWHFVNKEVLEQSARQLQLDQQKIIHKLEMERKTHLDEIVWAFGERYYKSDKKVRETIAEVIKHYAREGRVIIVGRAGAVILGGLENGLHVRLEAPFQWRVQSLVKRKMFSRSEAELYIRDADKKRRFILEQFAGKPMENICFDLHINTATFSQKQQIDLVFKALEQKGLL